MSQPDRIRSDPSAPRLVIAGGSGFLGRALTRFFAAQGWEVVILSRSKPSANLPARWVRWDGVRQGEWTAEISGAAALVNLAGRTVNCRYTAQNMLDIYASRMDSTRALGRAVKRADAPPPVWLNSSTGTLYRDARDTPQTEASGEIGEGFSVDVGKRWEAALQEEDLPTTRRVALRTAMVYGVGEGGVMQTTDLVVRLGGAGAMAGGGQYVSWIHELDFCRAVEFLIERDSPAAAELAGPFNITAPQPLTNREFLAAYRQAWGVPLGIPSTAALIKLGARVMNSEAELLLKSRWTVPERLLNAGFTFDFPSWPAAISDLVALARAQGHAAR
ncbi:TIGR01777 family protein [Deinococcus detaillensis]|uniref:TIGR01777 family protein n=1 Tax=Deinococcus detaillensis TaxID=2592048 RepID=A0A553V3Y3_9DEIO|nr:TIGR01777 family oxidoreductase [Deinococcus detaillensis]TSA87165.1 TIGR01777 family protein [Deinococcus detaillensis]